MTLSISTSQSFRIPLSNNICHFCSFNFHLGGKKGTDLTNWMIKNLDVSDQGKNYYIIYRPFVVLYHTACQPLYELLTSVYLFFDGSKKPSSRSTSLSSLDVCSRLLLPGGGSHLNREKRRDALPFPGHHFFIVSSSISSTKTPQNQTKKLHALGP